MKKEDQQDFKYVIGIDQSYTETAMCLMKDKELLNIYSLRKKSNESKHHFRRRLEERITNILVKLNWMDEYLKHTMVICERTRLKSAGFISMDSISSMIELQTVIANVCASFEVPLYSVDTRSWKAQIVGTSKAQKNDNGIDPKKFMTMMYVSPKLINTEFQHHLYRKVDNRTKNGVVHVDAMGNKYLYNDNVCDAYCITEYGFLPASKQKLHKVE